MIRLGMVGAGSIAELHSNAILDNPDCKLVSVADINISRAEKYAKIHDASFCTDYKEMDLSDLDAVILNVPHYLHCETAIYFLEKGIHVLVEKPMANTVEECDKMIAAAEKSGAKLAIGHVQRYVYAISEAKKIIDSEKYGKLSMITEVRNIDYTKNRPKWFLTKSMSGGGIVMNYGAHSMDKIFYTTGLSVKNVHAVLSNPVSDDDVEVNAQILLELSDGVSASITFCGNHIPYEYELSYYFTNGVVKVRNNSDLYVYENGEFVKQQGDSKIIDLQLVEFVKYINGEESQIVTPEYGKEVIKVLEKIL